MRTHDTVTHVEVYSDGAAFYCGLVGSEGMQRHMGLIEAKPFVAAAFHDKRLWREVPVADWPEDELCVRYENDAGLVRVFEYIPNADITTETR